MTEQMALRAEPADITVAYECFRDPSDPPVLPMMGGGEQMIAWPDGSTPVGHGRRYRRPPRPPGHRGGAHLVGASLGGQIAQTSVMHRAGDGVPREVVSQGPHSTLAPLAAAPLRPPAPGTRAGTQYRLGDSTRSATAQVMAPIYGAPSAQGCRRCHRTRQWSPVPSSAVLG